MVSAAIDSARKLFKLNGCTLCSITHGLAGERPEWQECKTELRVPVAYFHRDDMPADVRLAAGEHLPTVLARVGPEIIPLLSPDTLSRCNGKVADLRGRIRHHARLAGLTLP